MEKPGHTQEVVSPSEPFGTAYLTCVSRCVLNAVSRLLAGQTPSSEGGQLGLLAQQLDEEQHFPAHDSHLGPFK